MSTVERSSDQIEERSTTAVISGFVALALLGIGGLLYAFRGEGVLVPLSLLLMLFGIGALAYAVFQAMQIRKVKQFAYDCPYCNAVNRLASAPDADFTCVDCHRLVPVQEGKILSVSRVNCGYCREPNWYSDKTIVLLCEHCNHEIPISRGDGEVAHSSFAVSDDTRYYELSLSGYEHGTEDLVNCLQHMLALNRNQVKDLMTSLPTVLLTGIPKKKAELLATQLKMHGAAADIRPLD